jgi:hypothetical protein
MDGLTTLLKISVIENETSTIVVDQRVPAKMSSMAIHIMTIGGIVVQSPKAKK